MISERQEITKALCESKIALIDNSLTNIQDAVEKAFFEANDTTLSLQLRTFFLRIWGKCLVPPEHFKNVKVMSSYYASLVNKLNDMLEEHFQQEGLEATLIGDHTKRLFIQIIQIYYALAKQKYLLFNLKEINYVNSFTVDIKVLQNICCKKENHDYSDQVLSFKEEKFRAINESIKAISDVNYQLLNAIISRNYPRDKSIHIDKMPESSTDDFVLKIVKTLTELPTIDQLNKSIDNLKAARAAKVSEDIKKYTQQLEDLINKLQYHKRILQLAYEANIPKQELKIQQLLEEGEVIDGTLSLAKSMPIIKVMRILIAMNDTDVYKIDHIDGVGIRSMPLLAEAFTQTCAKQITRKYLNIGLWTNPWDVLADRVSKEIIEQSQSLSKMIDSYKPYFNNYSSIAQELQVMQQSNCRLEESRRQFASALSKVKVSFQAVIDAITNTQENLQSHIQLNHSTSKEFLTNHWLAIALGGVVFGGLSTALAVLTFSNPITLSVLISAGFIFGAALAAGGAIIKDECMPAKENSNCQEKQLLTPTTKSAKSKSFDQVTYVNKGHGSLFHRCKKQRAESGPVNFIDTNKNNLCPT